MLQPHRNGLRGSCGAGILPAQPDAGKMPAPQAETCLSAGTLA
jgi:hypothetical protein